MTRVALATLLALPAVLVAGSAHAADADRRIIVYQSIGKVSLQDFHFVVQNG